MSRGTAGVFAPVVLAYLVAAWCLAALAWDGAGYVFNTLQAGMPEISHHRYSDFPSLLAVTAASHLTDNARAVGVVYGIAVALTPVGALALCFAMLRGPQLAPLRIWCVLGILWAAFPGQICLMSEASLATQAFWPIAAFVLAACPHGFGMVIAVDAAYVFFLHPTAAILFATAAILCAWMAWTCPRQRKPLLAWGTALTALAVARLAFSVLTATPYERGELEFPANWNAYMGGLKGWPVWMLAALYALAASLLLKIDRRKKSALLVVLSCAFLGLAIFWAADATLWAGAISYRRFVLLATMPVIAAAAIHRSQIHRRLTQAPPPWLAPAAAAIFAVALVVQSLVWHADVVRFQHALEQANGPILTAGDIPWARGHAIEHWGSTMLSAILQGRTPRVLYTGNANPASGGDVEIFPGGWLRMNDGWFLLSNRRSGADDALRHRP